jgi:hypothetical protein
LLTFRSAPRLRARITGAAAAVAATAAAAALLGGIAAAQAGDATTLADRGGFLLGQALRCGASDVRLQPSAALIGKLIDAYSLDGDDRVAAQAELVERIVAGAQAKTAGDPLPACTAVLGQLASFEQHRLAPVDRTSAGQPGKTARQATTTGREEPRPQRGAALASQSAATRVRGGGRPAPPI